MAKYCVSCGKELVEGAAVCGQCGTRVSASTSTPVAPATPTPTPVTSKKGNAMAITGFVVSIVSFLLCCGTLSWLSLIFSIVGIVNANKVGGKGKGLAIAGTIISGLGFLLLLASFTLVPIWNSITETINDQWVDISDYGNTDDYDFDSYFDD